VTILKRRRGVLLDAPDDYCGIVRDMHAAARDSRLWSELRPRLVKYLIERCRQSPESAANIASVFQHRPSLLPGSLPACATLND
jgi:hypothetical protein